GFGKTSIFNYALPSQRIAYRKSEFIVSVGDNATNAILNTENLKRELRSNQSFVPLVGSIKPDNRDETFAKISWVTSGGTLVLPRGKNQQIRGLLHGNARPDLIVIDDLEDSESVMNVDQRKKLASWFNTDLLNSIDRSSKDWRVILIGTILHEDSLLQNLRESGIWRVHEMPLCDENYNTNWHEFMTTEEIKDLVEEHRKAGKLDEFYREYMNLAIAKEDAVFKQEYFKYYEESELDKTFLENVVIIDPAKTVKVHSAFSAIVGIGLDLSKPAVYVRDIVNRRLHPDEIYDEAFAMAQRLGAKVIGIEVTSLNEFITQPFMNEKLRRGLHDIEIVELQARKGEGEFAGKGKGKLGRIGSLVSMYRLGQVYHNKTCCGPLEAQLLAYPRAKHVDVSDATAYIIEMMEHGERWFHTEGADPGANDEEAYKRLFDEDEDPLNDDLYVNDRLYDAVMG
ncbi:hypothetical protein LCGC14_2052140, partial [marine sediment metagenome]